MEFGAGWEMLEMFFVLVIEQINGSMFCRFFPNYRDDVSKLTGLGIVW